MRFISGLKKLFKKPLLVIILLMFIITWFLILIGTTIILNPDFVLFILMFSGIFAGFIFVLLIFSIFKSIENMGKITIILAIILTVPIIIIFYGIVYYFYMFCFFANLFLIALFAYKWCIDNSIKLDNFLYQKKSSRKFTRIIEFLLFLLLSVYLFFITIIYFRDMLVLPNVANIFIFIVIINAILLIFVILRILLVQKLSAYISLFYVLSYLYVLYVIIEFYSTTLFGSAGSPHIGFEFLSFAIDLIIFIYIVGTIFDRIDYLKEKLPIFRVDTFALFIILMKIIVKIVEIAYQLNPATLPLFEFVQALITLSYFAFFALILGLYSIIFHKEGKK